MGRVIVLAGIFFVPILASAQSCGPQPEGPCIECGPYTNIWTLDYCPSQTNSSSVSPTEICQHYGDVPTIPTVVAPIYQAGQKETHDDYDCKDTVYIYVGISNSVGGVQWDPPLPAHLTNSFCSTAYINVTSSDTNWCASPGRVDIGSCCWCVSVVSTNCIYNGYFYLTNGTISPTNGCLGSAFSASASKITSNAMMVMTTHCPCSTNADINTTNYPAPTIVSNWWMASVGSFSTNGTGLSASFTPTDCGSGSVTFYLTYKNSMPCDTNVYSATPLGLSFNVLSLNITDGSGNNISSANSNNVVIVGQGVGLTAQTCGGTFSNFVWNVAGSAFSSYSANYQTGKVVTVFPLTNSSVSFYWKDGGSKSVSCSAVCAGVSCSTNVTITVVRPTAQIISKTGIVGLDAGALHDGVNTSISTVGISFTNTLTMPSGYYNSGDTNYSIEWVQKITSTVRRLQTNNVSGDWYRLSASDVLDTTYPYPFDAGYGNESSDSPSQGLGGTLYKSASVNDSFTRWLLFKPDGGEWVPLRQVNWSWSAAASLVGGTWSLTSGTNSPNPTDSDSTAHPEWTDNIIYHEFFLKE